MSALAFDTHKFVKDLTKAGMSDRQAEVLANHDAGLLNDRLANKDDIKSLQKENAASRKDMGNEIAALRNDMKHLEKRFTNKMMITVLSAQIVTIVTICTVTGYLLSIN